MAKKLFIIGAGGHGRVVAECAELTGRFDSIEFLDDQYPNTTDCFHWPIVGELADWQKYIDSAEFIVALGVNKFRLAISDAIIAANGTLTTVVHPTAVLSRYVSLEAGSVVCANATVNIGAKIGRAAIVNTSSSVDHDCIIGAGVHLSPGVHLAGQVTIKDKVWVGIGATINECLTIGENTIIGAGASVISDAKANALYVGVPAYCKSSN